MRFDSTIDHLRKKLPPFLFYIKSDVSSDSRFESDKEVLFSPKEHYIENFGWGPSNFKEVMAFFNAINRQLLPMDFEETYRQVFDSTGNMVTKFAENGIIDLPFYALYDIHLKSSIRFPVLLVKITKIWKKFCQYCSYNWEVVKPVESENHNLMMKKVENQFASRQDFWEVLRSKFNCLRTVCKEFCENPECKLTFIQNEHLYISDTEKRPLKYNSVDQERLLDFWDKGGFSKILKNVRAKKQKARDKHVIYTLTKPSVQRKL